MSRGASPYVPRAPLYYLLSSTGTAPLIVLVPCACCFNRSTTSRLGDFLIRSRDCASGMFIESIIPLLPLNTVRLSIELIALAEAEAKSGRISISFIVNASLPFSLRALATASCADALVAPTFSTLLAFASPSLVVLYASASVCYPPFLMIV